MEEQFRMLRAGNLLAELRSAVSVVHGNGTVSKGANLRLMFCIQSLAAPLRELLDAMLHTKVRADEWHQVPVVLVRNRRFRLTTLRDLKQLSHKFSALASHIKQVHTHHIPMRDGSSSHNIGVHAPVDALAARMVGRSELLEKMVSIVLCERTAHSGGLLFMPIIGGPGIGKTRLAMALLDDYRVRRKFAVRLAVPVIRHRQFCLERVLMLKITPERKHSNVEGNPQAMASHITRKLSGVDYLIVLDDVWSDKEGTCPEIGALMKALPPRGRLVITTRTPDVATYLETLADVTVTSKPFFLRPLEEHFSSSFVAEWTAAYPGDWPSELAREAGMMIAQKCEGVPSLLYYARTCFCQQQGRKLWQGFLEQSGNKARTGLYFWRELLACINDLPHDKFWQRFLRHSSELPDGNSVLESGSVSYQHLPSEMRSCLLYCSMFPSGYEFDPEELTDLLAAEGYIPPMVGNAQRKGFVQKLLDECFYPLQEHKYGDKCTYMMHKVLHIFAQNTDRKTSLVIKADQATQLTSNAEHAEGSLAIRRASLIVSPLDASIPASLLRCRDLGALILLQEGPMCPPDAPRCEISEIPQEFLQSSKHIQALSFRGTRIRVLPTKFLEPHLMKYLNLSQTDIENIPSSISRLMLLQTLVLSYCDKLLKLHPNTTKLAQLQKLDLEGCFNLVELPRDLSKMKRLEYLNVTECSSLTQLPCRMGEMKSLQTLLGYIVSPTDGSSVTELLSLENLHRLSLQCLQKVSDILDVRYARLDYKTNLESLSLRWDVDDNSSDSVPADAVLESLQAHRRLKSIGDCCIQRAEASILDDNH